MSTSLQGMSTKDAQTSQPRATPWVSCQKRQSPERAAHLVTPFQGFIRDGRFSQGVALGWLVAGPLALSGMTVTKGMTDTKASY